MVNEASTTLNVLHNVDNEHDIIRTSVMQYLWTEHYAVWKHSSDKLTKQDNIWSQKNYKVTRPHDKRSLQSNELKLQHNGQTQCNGDFT